MLVLAVDNSRSMIGAKDSLDVKEFFQKDFDKFQKELSDKFDIQTVSFGEQLNFNPNKLLFNEYKTDADNIFYKTQKVFQNREISAMLFITDGIFNQGTHPASQIQQNLIYPIYCLAIGDTTLYKDVLIKKINHNKNVFIGNDFIAEVLIQYAHVNNESVKISLYLEDKLIAEKSVNLNSETTDIKTINFQINANKAGNNVYKVVVSKLKDEINSQNNIAYFSVNVIEDKTKVLIVYSAPHPDIAAISEVLSQTPQYEIKIIKENEYSFNQNNQDVIIYHRPTNTSLLSNINKLGIPMFIISNQVEILKSNFLKVQQLLPNQYNESESATNTSFGSFALEYNNNGLKDDKPAVLSPYGDYTPSGGQADVLLYQKINGIITHLPLFYTLINGTGKYAVFLGDGLWRWKMFEYQQTRNYNWFGNFITQTIRFLSIRRDKSPFKLYIPFISYESDPIQIRAELYNESAQPITEPDVLISIQDSSNNQFKYVFNKATSSYYLDIGKLLAGNYTYKASCQYHGKDYVQSGKLRVLPLQLEKYDITANHDLLKIMCSKTDGKFYLLNQYHQFLDELNKNESFKTIISRHSEYTYWIENIWFFITLLILLTIEWIIRRWHGII